jgi:toxin ParE1/3/4
VGVFRFSRLAEADLLGIGNYTLRTWGDAQTIRYLDALEACCQMLADNPGAGRPCDDVRPGLYRKVGKHVIFFRREPDGIKLSRILHERMLPGSHLFDDADYIAISTATVSGVPNISDATRDLAVGSSALMSLAQNSPGVSTGLVLHLATK